jgi:hypothetical protein
MLALLPGSEWREAGPFTWKLVGKGWPFSWK